MERFKKIELGRDKFVDTETGEILAYNEVINTLKEEKRKVSDLINNEIEKIQKYKGVNNKKDTHYFDWNNTSNNPILFTKNYKRFGREVKAKMNMNEKGFLFTVIDYLETETNRVIVDGKNPDNKTLSKMTGVSSPTITRILSSLKQKNIVKTKGSGLGREIYINPLLVFDGKNIELKTLKMFGLK